MTDRDETEGAAALPPGFAVGDVLFLEVTAVTPIGAFVDWGLPKELLVPFAEQTRDLVVGDRHPIGLYVDKSGRLAGTMRVGDVLGEVPPEIDVDDWLEGEAWRNDPDIGLFAILERRFVGLVPASEPHRLKRGEPARFRVAAIQPDGKLVLSLRQHAYQELEADTARVLAVLARPGTPRVGDRTDAETIRMLFGMSKKAFKRAVGRLLKLGTVSLDPDSNVIVAPAAVTDQKIRQKP